MSRNPSPRWGARGLRAAFKGAKLRTASDLLQTAQLPGGRKEAELSRPPARSRAQIVNSRPPVSTKPCREYEPSRGRARFIGPVLRRTSMDREADRSIPRPPQLENRVVGRILDSRCVPSRYDGGKGPSHPGHHSP